MKKKIDWLNHALEFLVVLIGILIAFQLNEYGANKTKKDLLDSHLSYIQEESSENLARLEEGIKHSQTQVNIADSLLQLISSKKEIAEVNRLAVELLNLRKIDIRKNAYQVLIQSGDVRFLKNFETKKEIINLYESYQPVESIDISTQKIYDNYFYPYIKNNFDLVNWNFQAKNFTNQKEQYFSNEFGNIVSTYRYLLSVKVTSYSRCKEGLKKYIDSTKN